MSEFVGQLRDRLAAGGRAPVPSSGEGRYAAVAAIFRPATLAQGGAELLLIARAWTEGDPWSGHLALPGGHAEPEDADLLETARREAREEVGLSLAEEAQVIGRLPGLNVARARSKLEVVPFAFWLAGAGLARPNPAEVRAAFWMGVRELLSAGRKTKHTLSEAGQRYQLPAIQTDYGPIWGLTYRIVLALLSDPTSRIDGSPARLTFPGTA